MEIELCALQAGSAASVSALAPNIQRGRLEELGFTPGAGVRCLYEAAQGSPRAYLIRGAVIALRNADAATVKVVYAEN